MSRVAARSASKTFFHGKLALVTIASVLLAFVSSYAIFYFLTHQNSETKLPDGISSFDIKISDALIKAPENVLATARLSVDNDKKDIAMVFEKMLLDGFIKFEKNNPLYQSSLLKKVDGNKVATSGKAAISDLTIAYDEKGLPVVALSDITIKSSFMVKLSKPTKENEEIIKRYVIDSSGTAIFEKNKNGWEIFRLKLDRNTREFKMIKDE